MWGPSLSTRRTFWARLRYKVLQGDYSADKPSLSFAVHAWERWNPSYFAIQQGETDTFPGGGGHLRMTSFPSHTCPVFLIAQTKWHFGYPLT